MDGGNGAGVTESGAGMTERGRGGSGEGQEVWGGGAGVVGGWSGGLLEDDLELHQAGLGDGEHAEACGRLDVVVGQHDLG